MGPSDITDDGSVKGVVCDELEADEDRDGVDEGQVRDFCSKREVLILYLAVHAAACGGPHGI